jgi:hypothetical protein
MSDYIYHSLEKAAFTASRLGIWYYAALASFCALLALHFIKIRLNKKTTPKRKKLSRMRSLFTRRRRNGWFRLKVLAVVHIWALCDSPVRSRLWNNSFWNRRWSLVLLAARYCVIFPVYPLTALGLASKLGGEPEITVGLEPQITKFRAFRGTFIDGNLLRRTLASIDGLAKPLRSSAIDHELMHCVQQYFDNAIDKEAAKTITPIEELKYEVLACAAGPLSLLVIPITALLPVVVTLFLLYFLIG